MFQYYTMIFQLFLLAVLSVTIQAKKSYEGYKVIEINLTSDANVQLVLRLAELYEVDIWKGPSKVTSTHIMISPEAFTPFVNSLTDVGILYKIINDNVERTIEQEYIANTRVLDKSFAGFRALSLRDHYPTLQEIDNWLDEISKRQNYTSVGVVGRTYEGRSIKYIKLSTGRNRKAVLMDGGIHAREWLAVSTVNYIIEEMVTDYNKGNEEIVSLLSKYDFYFIPVLNPDGYVYSHTPGNRLWRKNRKPTYLKSRNCIGTDLNRNFDADFGGEKTSTNPCAETYGGPYAFSEPETTAFSDFVNGIRSNLQLYMSLHAYAQFWFVPYAYTSRPTLDDYEMRRVANIGNDALYRVNGVRFQVGIPADLLYAAAGGSFDWIKLKVGTKYSYTLEVRPEWGSSIGGQGFISPISNIELSGKEVYRGLIATAKAMRV